jgi:leucyl aminopeptidase
VVVCSGDNQPAQIRSAVQSGWGALKSAKVKHLGLHVVGDASPQVLQSALSHLADATYAYTTTLSQPKARVLKQVRVSAEKVTEAHASSVRHAQALIAGVELAKEWANRPANHATPSHLAHGGLHGRGPGRG